MDPPADYPHDHAPQAPPISSIDHPEGLVVLCDNNKDNWDESSLESPSEIDDDDDDDDESQGGFSSSSSSSSSESEDSAEVVKTEEEDLVDYGHQDPSMENMKANLLKQHHPSRMIVTPQERQWALAIKRAIEALPDLDPLTDFWYVQLAIVAEDNIDDAVKRAYRLQQYKRENQILDTEDDALRNLPRDRSWLSCDYDLSGGGYIASVDFTQVDTTIWKSPETIQHYHRRIFYGHHLGCPDFEAMRVGGIILGECEGYTVGKNGEMPNLQIFKGIWEDFYAYPNICKQVKFFNCNTMFKVLVSFVKGALPKSLGSKFQIAGSCPLGRLDRLYNLPTPEIAAARLKERMKGLIQKRYANEKAFRLE